MVKWQDLYQISWYTGGSDHGDDGYYQVFEVICKQTGNKVYQCYHKGEAEAAAISIANELLEKVDEIILKEENCED